MAGDEKGIAVKSSTNRLQEYLLPTYKTKKWASVESNARNFGIRTDFPVDMRNGLKGKEKKLEITLQ